MSHLKLFLKARWENLILVSYKVNPDILLEYLPKGLVPDTKSRDAFMSLVAFNFIDTKVKGIKVPFHINFPEINLRFYVKESSLLRRGVVFVREFVPRFFISFFANTLFNENYRSIPMKCILDKNPDEIKCRHEIKFKGASYYINLTAGNKPFVPANDSKEQFFKEHEWGFGRTRKGETLVYRVKHPVWEIYPVIKFAHNFDFGAIYGNKWNFLNNEKPYNVTFARGSEIKVYAAESCNSGARCAPR